MSEAVLRAGVAELTGREPLFARVVERHGFPLLWGREPGFGTLVHILLEQQVSLASARAAYERLQQLAGPVTAGSLLALSDEQLRAAGFSRQKARYARALATAVDDGDLVLEMLGELEDDDVDRALQRVPGIGPWTSSVYRLSALGRPDAWPVGDLAVAAGIAELWQLPRVPTAAEAQERAGAWRPWRAVAARLLWQHYLGERRAAITTRSPGKTSSDRPAGRR
ncbi:DNA-3-methyladenine glycosylase family protein [Symbioplanes lichenis]|uniref:DNA-3-methyladenine glycosylase family protein n=1 Tax=Symbioplanes lichenis TaxID=1629072 RepID=UPI00273A2D59|nr:DNA-3-methyladenine glycosylase 2 family protein [Actinoplanes lichenis]